MAQHSGVSGDALDSARAALAARDRELAEADLQLAQAVAGAHTIASEAIRRLGTVGAEIDTAVTQRAVDAPLAAHEFARFLVAKQREMIAIVSWARAEADAKTAVLQQLTDRFRASVPH